MHDCWLRRGMSKTAVPQSVFIKSEGCSDGDRVWSKILYWVFAWSSLLTISLYLLLRPFEVEANLSCPSKIISLSARGYPRGTFSRLFCFPPSKKWSYSDITVRVIGRFTFTRVNRSRKNAWYFAIAYFVIPQLLIKFSILISSAYACSHLNPWSGVTLKAPSPSLDQNPEP